MSTTNLKNEPSILQMLEKDGEEGEMLTLAVVLLNPKTVLIFGIRLKDKFRKKLM